MATDWETLKEEYIHTEGVTLRALAEKHGVSYQSLKKQSARNAWAKQKNRRQQQALRQNIRESTQACRELPRTLAQTEKINRIAEKLLTNIEEGTQLFEKPTHIATLTGALKEVTAILRDVNEIPNQKQRHDYELSLKKLELDSNKHKSDEGVSQGGVVMLPEVSGGGAAE